MLSRKTEQLHPQAERLDTLSGPEAALVLAEGQIAAAGALRAACGAIAAGAGAMAATIRSGGTLVYAAAGSSGLMAAADGMELGGTFGIPATRIRILMAGGIPTTPEMPGGVEDQTGTLDADLAGIGAGDTLIAVSASGSTPYTLAAATRAKAAGATVIGIANNAETPLLTLADHAIFLDTPPEVLSGSTRMGAGTAQKIALNMLSTLMALELGHICGGMMVNLRPENAKLRDRARGIIGRIARVDAAAAAAALRLADDDVKLACLMAGGAADAARARALLDADNGNLRAAMARLDPTNP